MTIQTLIIVPARSGSKGILDKNIKPLAGKPLLLWTITAIQQAQPPNTLAILSTDSRQYAELAGQAGLQVPFLRPAEFAQDSSASLAVVEHALQWFVKAYGYQPEQLMLLQPTSPFRSAALINQALALITETGADAVIGCKEIQRNLSTLFECADGFLKPLAAAPLQTARQQIKPLLTPNGAMYLCKTAVLLAGRSFFPEKSLPLVMNTLMSLDIDTPEDWLMAEALAQQGNLL